MPLAKTLSRTARVLGAGPRRRVVRDPGVQLRISVELRAQDQWCWAAVARGVQQAYGDNPVELQCDVATRVKKRTCCPAGFHSKCDEPHALEPALRSHLDDPVLGSPQSFTFVQKQIDAGHPVAVRIAFNKAQSGHFVVISGHYTEDGLNYIWVCDPATGLEDDYEFEAFKAVDPNGGVWDLTYRTTGDQPVPPR